MFLNGVLQYKKCVFFSAGYKGYVYLLLINIKFYIFLLLANNFTQFYMRFISIFISHHSIFWTRTNRKVSDGYISNVNTSRKRFFNYLKSIYFFIHKRSSVAIIYLDSLPLICFNTYKQFPYIEVFFYFLFFLLTYNNLQFFSGSQTKSSNLLKRYIQKSTK